MSDIKRSAWISSCGRYRYSLTRDWKREGDFDRTCVFVILNPSTADGSVDDPTIRKCISEVVGFSLSASGLVWVAPEEERVIQ